MSNNKGFREAKTKNINEWYTQYSDIEKEIYEYVAYNQDVFRDKVVLCPCDDPEWSNFTKFFIDNFEDFGLKKLISTSYSPTYNKIYKQPTLFEMNGNLVEGQDYERGKKFTLTKETYKKEDFVGEKNLKNLKWEYLEGDGDFRSKEVTRLRDEADFVITNPPFSLFLEFLDWIINGNNLGFMIMGDQNNIVKKDVFSLIKEDKLWLGYDNGGTKWFRVPDDYKIETETRKKIVNDIQYFSMGRINWFTNQEHGKRHESLLDNLNTKTQNEKTLKSKLENEKLKSKTKATYENMYKQYDNYDAIEIGWVEYIPNDYYGFMGVPLTFLHKLNPKEFDLLGIMNTAEVNEGIRYPNTPHGRPLINDKEIYIRVLIKRKDIQ